MIPLENVPTVDIDGVLSGFKLPDGHELAAISEIAFAVSLEPKEK